MNTLEIKNEGKNLELKLYGEIGKSMWDAFLTEEEKNERKENGEVKSLDELDKILKDNKDAGLIDVYINSTGGSVFEGIAIYNMLKRHKAYKRVFIEGFACSIASVIAMAGNSVTMPSTSMMMIHNAWTVGVGNANDFRKLADDLDKINESIRKAYMKKSNIEESVLTELMDKESYLTAEECLAYGLCDKVDDKLDATEDVAKNLDTVVALNQSKLETLKALKNAIKDIEDTNVSIEETSAEVIVDEPQGNETTESNDAVDVANENEDTNEVAQAKEEMSNIKENALKRFFNIKEE